MDLEVLKKKVSTFRGEGGRVYKVSDELLMEILFAWEQWTGPVSVFYKALGISQKRSNVRAIFQLRISKRSRLETMLSQCLDSWALAMGLKWPGTMAN